MTEEQFIGKTIKNIVRWNMEGFDDENVLQIIFTDNTSIFFISDFGGYTGESKEEYPSFVYTTDDDGFNKYNEDIKEWHGVGYTPITE